MEDFANLDYKAFELLVGLLLAREGFQITRTPTGGADFGPDFEAFLPNGQRAFVEVKHFRRTGRLPMSVIHHFGGEMERLRNQYANALGILVTSAALTAQAKTAVKTMGLFAVWDGTDVQRLLTKHTDVFSIVTQAQSGRSDVLAQLESLRSHDAQIRTFSAKLSEELRGTPPGLDGWKEFETL